MHLLLIVVASGAILAIAYRLYGTLLARLFRLDPNVKTPAVEMRDDVDYAPIEAKFLISQHFSAIAAAGPIVGPILAGLAFGWGPALIWILVGSIFIGGVHDMGALVASVRHRASSIAQVVREHMTKRSYLLFLMFVWIALIYIIVAFTDIVASSFVGKQTLEDGTIVSGGGIATSSLLYLALPIIMGLLLKYTKLSLNMATLIFLPLVGVAIWLGQKIPLDLGAMFNLSDAATIKLWDVLLLVYCFVAALTPMWILLQPRGHLGGYFLFVALGGGALGLIFGSLKGTTAIEYPAFTGFTAANGDPIFPLLFITIACGACSGFHSIIASGTTSKQLRTETDAKVIGYGSMLLEAMVAIVSLCCVMMLTKEASAKLQGKPNLVYANGMGSFMEVLGIPKALGISFGLLAFTTFVYDTLDVCTRLGRYIFEELTGWKGTASRWVGTALMAFIPLIFVMQNNNGVSAWKTYWPLFGASNQLLAALTLIGVTVWLSRTYKANWVWLVTGVPTVFMYIMSCWALFRFIKAGALTKEGAWKIPTDTVSWAAVILVALAMLVLLEAIRIFFNMRPPAPRETEAVAAPAAGE
ncbi:MAG TPA: carbon starvation CstA family protein [Planctomycetota bacterium]|nr:carbon starvation CstA family protein [Planctomycetota bacterium]